MSVQLIDAPIAVRTIDTGTEPIDAVLGEAPGGKPYNGLYALLLRDGLPCGSLCVPAAGGVVTAGVLRAAIAEAIDGSVANGKAGGGSAAPVGGTADDGSVAPAGSAPALVSVIVCCIDGGRSAVRTVETLLTGTYREIEVIVVNNRPENGRLEPVEERFNNDARVRTVDEPSRGLAYARNAGAAVAGGEILAFTDDDSVPDTHWIERLVATFERDSRAQCVTGMIAPLALDTEGQVLLERFAGYAKGFTGRSWSLERDAGDRLFPYRAGQFGSGANIALRTEAFASLGGYDTALGIGTPANGGEDLDLFIRVLINGMQLNYEPSALIWHDHPRTIDHIEREVQLYGSGLTAALFKQLVCGPRRRRLLAGMAGGIHYALNPSSEKNARKGEDFPLSYTVAELRGMLYGPLGYLRSRRLVRRNGKLGGARRGVLVSLSMAAGLFGGAEAAEASAAEASRVKTGFEPVWIGQLELTDPPVDLVTDPRADGGVYSRASLLVRSGGDPVGFVRLQLNDGRIGGGEVRAAVKRELGEQAGASTGTASPPTAEPDSNQPPASVVICSRDRAESLKRALRSVLALNYPEFEVVVVDNAPDAPGTRQAVDAVADGRVRYVAEPLPGLSRARNRGLSEASGEIIAFTDDDVEVDEAWLTRLANAFDSTARVGCVTGLVPTAELQTEAQAIFDASVNWSRALERRIYDLDRNRGNDALYPYRTGRLGTGANFAVSRAAAADTGPFDEALGAGSPAGGGEDLDYFFRLIDGGWAIAVEPSAIVWHYHRIDQAALQRQFFTYGSGAMAYGVKHAVQPRHAAGIIGRSAVGLLRAGKRRHQIRPVGVAVVNLPQHASAALRGAKWRGRIAGPALYVKGRIRARSWERI